MWFNIPLFSRRKFDQNAIFNQGNLYHTYTRRVLRFVQRTEKSGVYGRPAGSSSGEHVTLKKSKLADHDPNQMHFAKDEH